MQWGRLWLIVALAWPLAGHGAPEVPDPSAWARLS